MRSRSPREFTGEVSGAPQAEGAATRTAEDLEDDALVLAARVDPEAVGKLYDRYSDRIFRFLCSRLGDPAAAEDATSDVFVKVVRGIDSYRPERGTFRRWLFTVAANTGIDRSRSRRPTVPLEAVAEMASGAAGPEVAAERQFEMSQIREAMATLGEAQRSAVALRFGEDLGYPEIARILGKSEGAVRVIVHRGMAQLRERLAQGQAGDAALHREEAT